MSPMETLRLWFAAFAEEDLGRARDLWSEDGSLHAPDGGFTGDFDQFLRWYARRRDSEGPGFTWQVEDVLGGDRYAAAVLRLVSNNRPAGWNQHAVYEIDGGKIRRVWLHEPASPDQGPGS